MDSGKAKILIADDEARIRMLVSDFLKSAGFEVAEAADGEEAVLIFEKSGDISLAILDIMMPGLDGWEVCRRIRAVSSIPIIMLTARADEFDHILAFEAGTDEYVTKPFSPTVLVKRVEALLRRSAAAVAAPRDELIIKKDAYTATLNGKPLDLTLKEFELLNHLYENPGRVFSRDQLLDALWGYDFLGDSRTVDSHIARLRLKLGDYGTEHLKTVYGIGYKLEV